MCELGDDINARMSYLSRGWVECSLKSGSFVPLLSHWWLEMRIRNLLKGARRY